MTAAMREALAYARSVGVVREWPDHISDATIKRLRREGYLKTEVVSWHVHPAGGVYWHSITDRPAKVAPDA